MPCVHAVVSLKKVSPPSLCVIRAELVRADTLTTVPLVAISAGVPIMQTFEDAVWSFADGWLASHPSGRFIVSGCAVPVRPALLGGARSQGLTSLLAQPLGTMSTGRSCCVHTLGPA